MTAFLRNRLRDGGFLLSTAYLTLAVGACSGPGEGRGEGQAQREAQREARREAQVAEAGMPPAEIVAANVPLAAPLASFQDPSRPQQEVDRSRTTALVRASERVSPAVVSVNTLRQQPVQARTPWEERFFGPARSRQSLKSSLLQ